MNKSRLLLSLVLVLAMVMSFGALAYADDVPEAEEQATQTFTVLGDDDEETEVEAMPITADMTALEGGETFVWYYVEGNVQLDHTLEVNGECAVILKEDSVLEFTQSEGVGIKLNADSGLRLDDCDGGNGLIKTAQADTVLIGVTENAKLNLNGANLYAAGSCIVATDTGDVCLYSGSIETGESSKYAVVLQDYSTGELDDATINAGGHGISSDCNGFAMYGGSIEAAGFGVENTVGFKMFGGEILNCCAGIRNYGELALGGTAKIQDNGIDGVYGNVDIVDGSSIIMEEAAEEGFAVGIFTESFDIESETPVTDIAVMADATEDTLNYFTHDIDGTELYVQDGVLYLGLVMEEEPVTTASVFSSSTGLLIAGGVLIIVVAIVVAVMKKKPMN